MVSSVSPIINQVRYVGCHTSPNIPMTIKISMQSCQRMIGAFNACATDQAPILTRAMMAAHIVIIQINREGGVVMSVSMAIMTHSTIGRTALHRGAHCEMRKSGTVSTSV